MNSSMTAAFLAACLAQLAHAQPTVRVSLSSAGDQPSGGFQVNPAISADGRHVVWATTSTNLAPIATSGYQVLAHDRDPDNNGAFDEGNGVTTLMTLGVDGLPGDQFNGGFSGFYHLDISADGRYVMWSSQSANLINNDLTGRPHIDVFVRDRDPDGNGVFDEPNAFTQRINDPFGEANSVDNGADQFGISDDGRYRVYSSSSTNLVIGDSPDNVPNIYLHDAQTNTTNRLDLATASANVGSRYPQISGNGGWIAYFGIDTNFLADSIWVTDHTGISPVLVSKNDLGQNGNADAGGNPNTRGPRLSNDGRFVVFQSLATNLDITRPNDQTTFFYKLFIHDRDTDADGVYDEPGAFTTRRIDVAPNGDPANAICVNPDISGDGSFVVFQSAATNLDPSDTNGSGIDIFRYDVASGSIDIISRSTTGVQSNSTSIRPTVSDDGSWVVFSSLANNLVAGDTSGSDVFCRATNPPCPADLAAPFGTLNFFDIAAYIALYNAGDPAADIAAPFGSLNFFDLAAYITRFNAGCP